MDWSVKSMLQESLRSLIKSEVDLGIELAGAKANVQRALVELDNHPRKCTRCWGRGVIKCMLCGAEGEIHVPVRRQCTRCIGCALERCPGCAGYGLV